MQDYKILESTDEEIGFIDKGIVEFNFSQVPFTQKPAFIPINRIIKDINGTVLAGINSVLYCWNCLYIDILWVKDEYRNSGFGSALLDEVEKMAKEKGCTLVHLDTFDFQAKDFYIKHKYEVFGVLDNCPTGHQRYYLKKDL